MITTARVKTITLDDNDRDGLRRNSTSPSPVCVCRFGGGRVSSSVCARARLPLGRRGARAWHLTRETALGLVVVVNTATPPPPNIVRAPHAVTAVCLPCRAVPTRRCRRRPRCRHTRDSSARLFSRDRLPRKFVSCIIFPSAVVVRVLHSTDLRSDLVFFFYSFP